MIRESLPSHTRITEAPYVINPSASRAEVIPQARMHSPSFAGALAIHAEYVALAGHAEQPPTPPPAESEPDASAPPRPAQTPIPAPNIPRGNAKRTARHVLEAATRVAADHKRWHAAMVNDLDTKHTDMTRYIHGFTPEQIAAKERKENQ